MKNKKILLISILVILVSFLVLINIYNSNTKKDYSSLDLGDAPFVRPHSVVIGNKNAKNVIVEWSDPQCIACKSFHPNVKKILKEYKDEIKLVIRHVPNHKNSEFMIKILSAAQEQGMYEDVLEVMYNYFNVLSDPYNPKPKFIWNYLEDVENLDIKKLKKDFNKQIHIDNLRLDVKDAGVLKVRGTPTFYVNKVKLEDFSAKGLLDLVEEEIYKD